MVFTGPADRGGVVVASQPQQDGVPVEFDVVSANKGRIGIGSSRTATARTRHCERHRDVSAILGYCRRGGLEACLIGSLRWRFERSTTITPRRRSGFDLRSWSCLMSAGAQG